MKFRDYKIMNEKKINNKIKNIFIFFSFGVNFN